jgi:hypothetical protein
VLAPIIHRLIPVQRVEVPVDLDRHRKYLKRPNSTSRGLNIIRAPIRNSLPKPCSPPPRRRRFNYIHHTILNIVWWSVLGHKTIDREHSFLISRWYVFGTDSSEAREGPSGLYFCLIYTVRCTFHAHDVSVFDTFKPWSIHIAHSLPHHRTTSA